MKSLFIALIGILLSASACADNITCYFGNRTIEGSGIRIMDREGYYILRNNGKLTYYPIKACILETPDYHG